jgi:hypothetical protein
LVLHATLVALARLPVAPDDERTQEQRRADLLHAAVTGRVAVAGHPGDLARVAAVRANGSEVDGWDGVRHEVRVDVTIPLDSLLGGPEPGEAGGLGVIDAAAARRLATLPEAARTVRGVLFDPTTGRLCGLTSRGAGLRVTWCDDLPPAPGYRHTETMRAVVELRDRTCRHPGCSRRATACDCDHVVPYPQGPTHPDNTCCLCRRHHRLKTHAKRWEHVFDPDRDRLTVTTPTGHRAASDGFDYRPVPDQPPF